MARPFLLWVSPHKTVLCCYCVKEIQSHLLFTAALHTAVIKALRKGGELISDSSRLACNKLSHINKKIIHRDSHPSMKSILRAACKSTSTQSKICSSPAMSSSSSFSSCLFSSSGESVLLETASVRFEPSERVKSNFWKVKLEMELVQHGTAA